MAKFSYEDLEKQQSNSNNNTTTKEKSKVGYFNSLKNDKDEAIVRFNYSNANEFDLLKVHNVKVGDNYRFISCLRSGVEPLDACPLCLANEKVQAKMFVKLLEYVKNENGVIEAKPKIWARPANFANQLKTYLDEYGDLRDFVFKIKRNGEHGSLQTSYDIIVPNQSVYNENVYVKDFSAFDGFDLKYHSYYDLTFNEVDNYCKTGKIVKDNEQEQTQTQNNNQTIQFPDDLPFYPKGEEPKQTQQNITYQQAEQNPYPPQQQVQGTQYGINYQQQNNYQNNYTQGDQGVQTTQGTTQVETTQQSTQRQSRRTYNYNL